MKSVCSNSESHEGSVSNCALSHLCQVPTPSHPLSVQGGRWGLAIKWVKKRKCKSVGFSLCISRDVPAVKQNTTWSYINHFGYLVLIIHTHVDHSSRWQSLEIALLITVGMKTWRKYQRLYSGSHWYVQCCSVGCSACPVIIQKMADSKQVNKMILWQ